MSMSDAAPASDVTAAPAAEAAAAVDASASALATAPAAPAQAAAPRSLLTDDDEAADPGAAADAVKEGDAKKEGEGEGDKKADKPEGAPPEYEAFKLPENVSLDDAVIGDFKGLAKELNLSQDKAQKLVDLGASMQSKNATAFVQQQQGFVDKMAKGWEAEIATDPELGGAKQGEVLSVAKRAMTTFGTPALKQLLAQSRLGSHPEIVRAFYKAGQAISQDGFVPGRASSAPKSDHEVFYGNSTPSK